MASSTIGLCGNPYIQNVSTKNVSNGRVDIMEPPPDIRFSMWDKIPVNQVTTFRDAMTGNWIDNDVSNTFFSAVPSKYTLASTLKPFIWKVLRYPNVRYRTYLPYRTYHTSL